MVESSARKIFQHASPPSRSRSGEHGMTRVENEALKKSFLLPAAEGRQTETT